MGCWQLKIKKKDKLYIVYNNQLEKFSFEEHFTRYSNINFLKLERNTSGPVETIYELTSILEKNLKNEGLLILDGDTFYKKNIISKINEKHHTIFYHKTKIKDPIFSYIKFNKNKIYEITEKKKTQTLVLITLITSKNSIFMQNLLWKKIKKSMYLKFTIYY